MKSLSVGQYVALAFIFLFVMPVTLWTAVYAGMWTYGVLLFPAVA